MRWPTKRFVVSCVLISVQAGVEGGDPQREERIKDVNQRAKLTRNPG
jgi:hypothetical protein